VVEAIASPIAAKVRGITQSLSANYKSGVEKYYTC